VAWFATAVAVLLIYGVPAASIGVAYLLGRHERTSSSELLARRLAHLAVASPSLFVLIGVVFYLLHSPNGDSVFWSILWLTALAVAAWTMRRKAIDTPTRSIPAPIMLRVAHGSSALLIVLIFLAWHLLNHASAAFSPEFNQAMMSTLRKWYRSDLVQPVLVTLMLFQVVSGVILVSRATAARSDLSLGLRCSGGSPARRVERAAHSPLFSRCLVGHHSHGTRAPGRIARSPGIAARSRPRRMGCERARGGVCPDDHRCTTKRPRRLITSLRVVHQTSSLRRAGTPAYPRHSNASSRLSCRKAR